MEGFYIQYDPDIPNKYGFYLNLIMHHSGIRITMHIVTSSETKRNHLSNNALEIVENELLTLA